MSAACCDFWGLSVSADVRGVRWGLSPKGRAAQGAREVAGPLLRLGGSWWCWLGEASPAPPSITLSSREQDANQPAAHGGLLQRLTDPSLGVTGPMGICRFPCQM